MDEEKDLFLGEVKSENEEEDTEEKKKRPHFWKGFAAGAGAMFLVAGAVFCVTNGVVDRLFYPENAGSLSLSGLKTSRKLSELSNVINYYYLNDIDEEQVEDWMYKGVMAGLEDPYADYYSEEELNSLKESTSGSYKGIGAVMTQDKDTSEISVVRCYENTPAAESGLLPGDIVTKYNGEDTSGLDLTEIVNEIKTGENDEITFTIKREGESEEKEITLTRRAVDIPTVTSEMLENNIGYLEISEFDTVTLEQFQEAKASLESQGMEKLIDGSPEQSRRKSFHGGGYFEGDLARGPHRLHGRPVWKPDGVQLRRGQEIRDPAGGADQRRQRQCIRDFCGGCEGLRHWHSGGDDDLWKRHRSADRGTLRRHGGEAYHRKILYAEGKQHP